MGHDEWRRPEPTCCGMSPPSGRLPLVLTDTCSSPGATTERRACGRVPTAIPWVSPWRTKVPSRRSVSVPTAPESRRRVPTATARVWDAHTGEASPRRLSMPAECGRSSSARMVVALLTAGDDQTARLWALSFDKRPLLKSVRTPAWFLMRRQALVCRVWRNDGPPISSRRPVNGVIWARSSAKSESFAPSAELALLLRGAGASPNPRRPTGNRSTLHSTL